MRGDNISNVRPLLPTGQNRSVWFAPHLPRSANLLLPLLSHNDDDENQVNQIGSVSQRRDEHSRLYVLERAGYV